jgi:hypothetical protein
MNKYLAFTTDCSGRWSTQDANQVFVFKAKDDKTALSIALGKTIHSTKLTSLYRIIGGLKIKKVPIRIKGIVKQETYNMRPLPRDASLIVALKPIRRRAK